MIIKGMDVSKWNGDVAFAKAKAAGHWYSYAVSGADSKPETTACHECIRGKRFEYPIYFDLEEPKQLEKGKNYRSQRSV